jgi:hypothetical protein
VDTPVAVGWQLGDDRLDLRHEFIVWQRWPADPSPGAKRTDFDRIVHFESISFLVQAQGFMVLFLPFGS